MRDFEIVAASREPERRAPSRPVSAIEYQLAEAVLGAPIARFMAPMRDSEIVAATHELKELLRQNP